GARLRGGVARGFRRLHAGARELAKRKSSLHRSHGQTSTYGDDHRSVYLYGVRSCGLAGWRCQRRVRCCQPRARAYCSRRGSDRGAAPAANRRATPGEKLMSPSAALTSDVFEAYVKLAIALLGGSGVLLVILTYGLKRQIGGVWRTYIGW